jgi:exodeoxyribonuclease VII small subunit
MADEELSFEAGYAELEQLVARLQQGGLTIEESMALFQRGMALARRCAQQLDEAELRVRQLMADGHIDEAEPGA